MPKVVKTGGVRVTGDKVVIPDLTPVLVPKAPLTTPEEEQAENAAEFRQEQYLTASGKRRKMPPKSKLVEKAKPAVPEEPKAPTEQKKSVLDAAQPDADAPSEPAPTDDTSATE